MSDATTKRMVSALMLEASTPMFLASFFRSPPENFFDSEKVEFDVERHDEDVAVVVQDLTVGPRENEATKYTNKEIKPPVYKEAATITSFDLIKREPGQHPFVNPNYQANAIVRSRKVMRKLENKIRRALELQASQIFQTGQLALKDETGATLYAIDFKAKTAHMATAGTTWATDGTTGNPESDLESLAQTVRRTGKREPTDLVFGKSAWSRYLANPKTKERLDSRRGELAAIAPQRRESGATRMGQAWVGSYLFNLWTYTGFYKDPQTGNYLPFVSDDNVIMLSAGARLDAFFGAIPRIVGPESRVLPFLPERISDSGRGIDMSTNAWLTPDGEHLKVSVGSRPVLVPTEIDSFARLDVTA